MAVLSCTDRSMKSHEKMLFLLILLHCWYFKDSCSWDPLWGRQKRNWKLAEYLFRRERVGARGNFQHLIQVRALQGDGKFPKKRSDNVDISKMNPVNLCTDMVVKASLAGGGGWNFSLLLFLHIQNVSYFQDS